MGNVASTKSPNSIYIPFLSDLLTPGQQGQVCQNAASAINNILGFNFTATGAGTTIIPALQQYLNVMQIVMCPMANYWIDKGAFSVSYTPLPQVRFLLYNGKIVIDSAGNPLLSIDNAATPNVLNAGATPYMSKGTTSATVTDAATKWTIAYTPTGATATPPSGVLSSTTSPYSIGPDPSPSASPVNYLNMNSILSSQNPGVHLDPVVNKDAATVTASVTTYIMNLLPAGALDSLSASEKTSLQTSVGGVSSAIVTFAGGSATTAPDAGKLSTAITDLFKSFCQTETASGKSSALTVQKFGRMMGNKSNFGNTGMTIGLVIMIVFVLLFVLLAVDHFANEGKILKSVMAKLPGKRVEPSFGNFFGRIKRMSKIGGSRRR